MISQANKSRIWLTTILISFFYPIAYNINASDSERRDLQNELNNKVEELNK